MDKKDSLWDENGRLKGNPSLDRETMRHVALMLIEQDQEDQRLRDQLDDWKPDATPS